MIRGNNRGKSPRQIDWMSPLALDAITVGVDDLDLAASTGLHEKTNREGFVENEPFTRLKRIVLGALFIAQKFKLKPDRTDTGQLVVVPGGAACDHAQGNSGQVPIFFGLLLVPTSALSKDTRGQAIHACPEKVLLPGEDEPFTLLVHARFATTVVSPELARWPQPVLRIREQLLTILVHAATHAIRPGTLRF